MNWRSAFKISRAETALGNKASRHDREIFWAFPSDHCFRLTLDGNFLRVSDAFCTLLGHERSEFIGNPVDRFTCPNALDIPKHLGAICHFGFFRGLWVFVHREGKGIVMRYSGELLPDGFIEVRADLLPDREA